MREWTYFNSFDYCPFCDDDHGDISYIGSTDSGDSIVEHYKCDKCGKDFYVRYEPTMVEWDTED